MIYLPGKATTYTVANGGNVFNQATGPTLNPNHSTSVTLTTGANAGITLANAGTYQVTYGVMYVANATAEARASLTINNALVGVYAAIDTVQDIGANALSIMNSLTAIVVVSAGETISIQVTNSGAGPTSINSAFSSTLSTCAYVTVFRLL